MEQNKDMTPDAIVVLAGGIKRESSGSWVSTDLTSADNEIGAPGGKLRVLAVAVLARKYSAAMVIASGGKGYDVPKDAVEDHPLIAKIVRDELIECGVSISRLVLEEKSNTTYQQLRELEILITKRSMKNVMIVTSRYHLPRLRAMVEMKFPRMIDIVKMVSAEEVLLETDSARWKNVIVEAYSSAFMAERMAKEEQGVSQIKDSTYQWKSV